MKLPLVYCWSFCSTTKSKNNGTVSQKRHHYNDVIMDSMASQITSLTIVYSGVYSGADQRKTSKLRVTGLCAGNSPGTGEFPAQMASNAGNASIWWRHHYDLETLSSLLALVAGGFRPQRPVMRTLGNFFVVSLNKMLYKQWQKYTKFWRVCAARERQNTLISQFLRETKGPNKTHV